MTINTVSETIHLPRTQATDRVPVVTKQLTAEKPTIVAIGSRVSVHLANTHGGTIGYYPVESYMRLVTQFRESNLDVWA